jgi:hypothetical protein
LSDLSLLDISGGQECEQLKGAPLKQTPGTLVINIKLGCKYLTGTNTLACCAALCFTTVKNKS